MNLVTIAFEECVPFCGGLEEQLSATQVGSQEAGFHSRGGMGTGNNISAGFHMGVKKIGNIILIQLSDIDSNIYLYGDTVIDTGTGFNFIRLRDVLRVFKSSLEGVKTIVNTHYHFDHIGGNGYFENGKIWIHEKDAPIVEKGDTEATVADFFGGNIRPMKVDKKLKEGDKIKFGDLNLDVIHTPGHTPGSICLYEPKQKILFSGDTVFANGFGRTDLPGGNPEDLKRSLDKLAKLNVDKILPGHGDVVQTGGSKVIQGLAKNFKPLEEDEIDDFDNPI